jgi:hypothetical protein
MKISQSVYIPLKQLLLRICYKGERQSNGQKREVAPSEPGKRNSLCNGNPHAGILAAAGEDGEDGVTGGLRARVEVGPQAHGQRHAKQDDDGHFSIRKGRRGHIRKGLGDRVNGAPEDGPYLALRGVRDEPLGGPRRTRVFAGEAVARREDVGRQGGRVLRVALHRLGHLLGRPLKAVLVHRGEHEAAPQPHEEARAQRKAAPRLDQVGAAEDNGGHGVGVCEEDGVDGEDVEGGAETSGCEEEGDEVEGGEDGVHAHEAHGSWSHPFVHRCDDDEGEGSVVDVAVLEVVDVVDRIGAEDRDGGIGGGHVCGSWCWAWRRSRVCGGPLGNTGKAGSMYVAVGLLEGEAEA